MICRAARSIGCRVTKLIRAFPVERAPKRIDDAPEQTIADRNINDSPRSPHFRARAQVRVVAKQHHADFFFIEIECNTR